MDREELLERIEDLGSDRVSVFGGKWTGGIHLQQVPAEITDCMCYLMKAGTRIRNYLEIGAAAGGTAYLFDMLFEMENIVIIDDNRHRTSSGRLRVLEKVKYAEYIGDSKSAEAVEFVEKFGSIFDVVFIDGDHRYPGVSSDVENYSKFISPGGYLILHDTVACKGVKRIFTELKSAQNFQMVGEFVDFKHHRPCGIGVFRKRE